jgi:probable HAF family extracellular repeat protein
LRRAAILLVCLVSCGEDPQAPRPASDSELPGRPGFAPTDLSIVNLGTVPGCALAEARGINNRGQIVGLAVSYGGICYHAFYWENGVMTDLIGTVSPSNYGSAEDINELGQVVGHHSGQPVMWMNGSETVLSTPHNAGIAYGINESGTIVGTATNLAGHPSAALWSAPSQYQDLGDLPGADQAWATAINASGVVVGQSSFNSLTFGHRGWMWSLSGGMVNLGLPPGASDVHVEDINDHGVIVAWSIMEAGGYSTFRWSPGVGWEEIGDFPGSGWRQSQAYGINNAGVIVGNSNYLPSGPCRGTGVLCPVAWFPTGEVVDLGPAGTLLGGDAYEINEVGQVAGARLWPLPNQQFNRPLASTNGTFSGIEGSTFLFDGSSSSDPLGRPLTYTWNFGDGTPPATGAQVSHTYIQNSPVPYPVLLTVQEPGGLTSTVGTSATIVNVAPTVTIIAATDTARVFEDTVAVTVAFSDPGIADGNWTIYYDWEDSPIEQQETSPTQGTHTATHVYSTTGTYGVRVSVRDKDGGFRTDTTEIVIRGQNRIPTMIPGGPYSGVEGSPISFDGSQSSDPDGDPVTFEWNFHGVVVPGNTAAYTYLDNGTFTPFLKGTDSYGASQTGTASVTVTNANPVLAPNPDRTISGITVLVISAAFQDPGLGDGPFKVTQHWGDGASLTVTTNTQGFSTPTQIGGHSYAAPGTYQAITTVTDKDGGIGRDTFNVTVTGNTAPVIVINGPYSGNEGVAVAFRSTGTTDPDGDALTYRWNFGDGTPISMLLNPTHAFKDNGIYTVRLTIDDARGLTSTTTTTATITNVAPTGTFNRPASINEGAGFTLSITGANDVAADKTAGFQYSFDCGTGFGAFSSASSRQCPQQADNGTVAVAGQVRDKDGGVRTYSGTVQVKNVVPKVTLTATGATTIPRGSAFSASATFTDPGTTDAPWTWLITWGDGTSSTGSGTPGVAIPVSHVYPTVGVRTVKMTVRDKNGGSGVSNSITVRVQ